MPSFRAAGYLLPMAGGGPAVWQVLPAIPVALLIPTAWLGVLRMPAPMTITTA